ncbi:very short patch repair endonuclease [Microbacterium sp.]|uniref:very short patch repair endonuclease n=1 Tax=Microbacterium sp. TaxID=51671 RepID=UPI003C22D130
MNESWASSDHARRTMRANKSRDTKPERLVRSILHAHGLRYRTHFRPVLEVRRTADIVFTRQRLAVFIDGCFWHACPEHFISPKTNGSYWASKIDGNKRRDVATDDYLREAGWTVLRFWEHETPSSAADAIEGQVALLRQTVQSVARKSTPRRES